MCPKIIAKTYEFGFAAAFFSYVSTSLRYAAPLPTSAINCENAYDFSGDCSATC